MKVLATRRAVLHVAGEQEHAVPPLPPCPVRTPSLEIHRGIRGGAALRSSMRVGSGPVFELDRDQRRGRGPLDPAGVWTGLPLAIELVAARSKVLAPPALARRLDQALDVASLDRSRESRQRTVRAAIAWSYDLLTPVQARVLECLGIFEGGAGLEALTVVVRHEELDGADLLEVLFGLVDASLVQVHDGDDGEPRLSLLETVRMFARERLGQRDVLADRQQTHAQFFDDLSRECYDGMRTAEHAKHRTRFLAELGNLRAMLAAGRARRPPLVLLRRPGPDLPRGSSGLRSVLHVRPRA